MTNHFSLIVSDASPLITLAAADSLPLLLMPGIPTQIPDMVYYEVTRDLSRIGAGNVITWARKNAALVHITPTQVYADYVALQNLNPNTSSRGRAIG